MWSCLSLPKFEGSGLKEEQKALAFEEEENTSLSPVFFHCEGANPSLQEQNPCTKYSSVK